MADEDLSGMHVNGLVIRQLFKLSWPQHTVEQTVGRNADRRLEHCDHVGAFFHSHLAIVNGDLDQVRVFTFVRMLVMLVPGMLRRFRLLDFYVDDFDAAIRERHLSPNLKFANDAGVRRLSVDVATHSRGHPLEFVALPYRTCRFHGNSVRSC
ncbi:hypothetical protein WI23_02740 [Burkholderia oklahomensis C6786]|nr:hypothetical protein WI23_02740 [Burkholderia oklahomensis C6786]KUY65276.1 hypothetical protein WI23_04310 [Burkholderia oklahomensis C6786]